MSYKTHQNVHCYHCGSVLRAVKTTKSPLIEQGYEDASDLVRARRVGKFEARVIKEDTTRATIVVAATRKSEAMIKAAKYGKVIRVRCLWDGEELPGPLVE